jgi:hypothetical protein
MRRAVAFFLSCGLASAVNAAEANYPVVEILDAFRDGCGSLENQQVALASLIDAGWAPISRSEETGQLAVFLNFARNESSEAAELADVDMGEILSFAKTIAGEDVFIVLDEVRADGQRISGCQLYDFGEHRPIPVDQAGAWLKRAPSEVKEFPEVRTAEWSPGMVSGHDSFKIFFVPSDSPARQMFNFYGVALKADTLGAE